jgi:hypothetical protein
VLVFFFIRGVGINESPCSRRRFDGRFQKGA